MRFDITKFPEGTVVTRIQIINEPNYRYKKVPTTWVTTHGSSSVPSSAALSGMRGATKVYSDVQNIDFSEVQRLDRVPSYTSGVYALYPTKLTLDLPKVTHMTEAFGASGCTEFTILNFKPQYMGSNSFSPTAKVIKYIDSDFSNCTSLSSFGCVSSVERLEGDFDFGNLTTIGANVFSAPNLQHFSGLRNLKLSPQGSYNFNTCTKLTYESCINILNGLYDFTGNGETPNSKQGVIKVAQSFLDLVGDEISIATNKSWTVTV